MGHRLNMEIYPPIKGNYYNNLINGYFTIMYRKSDTFGVSKFRPMINDYQPIALLSKVFTKFSVALLLMVILMLL